jgi:hypothetical protein
MNVVAVIRVSVFVSEQQNIPHSPSSSARSSSLRKFVMTLLLIDGYFHHLGAILWMAWLLSVLVTVGLAMTWMRMRMMILTI